MKRNIVITIITAILVTGFLLYAAIENLYHRENKIFDFEVGTISTTIRTSITDTERIAHSIQNLFHASENVDADEFRIFSSDVFSNYPFVKGTLYSPRILEKNRKVFVDEQRYWGMIMFEIHEYNQGEKVKATQRKEYYPVKHYEPFLPETAGMIGLDMVSQDEINKSFARSVLNGEASYSFPQNGISDLLNEYQLLIPVYQGKQWPKTDEGRIKMVNGMVALVIQPAKFISEKELSHMSSTVLAVSDSDRKTQVLLLDHSDKTAPNFTSLNLSKEVSIASLEHNFILRVEKSIPPADLNLWGVLSALIAGALFSFGLFLILKGQLKLKNELIDKEKAQQALKENHYRLEEAHYELAKREGEVSNLRNYLSNIINSMPSMLIGVDTSGYITQWNNEAEIQTKVLADEAIGKELHELLPRLELTQENINKIITGRKTTSILKKAYYKEDAKTYEDITIYPLIANGLQGAVIRIDDVTSRTHMEESMIQSEKMSSVSGLAAGMAHEINNPLAVISQGIQNIQRRLKPDNPKNVKRASEFGIDLEQLTVFLDDRKIYNFLASGRDAVNRAAQIVKNMLLFSRKSDSSRVMCNLQDIIEHTIELGATDYDMKKKYDFKFVDIVKEYDEDLPYVCCCQGEIEQVLLNLFKNALQAMEAIKAEDYKPLFRIRLAKEKEYARIEIEDNGPGIPDAVQSHIFEPFYTTKPVGEGTGLGLSVSYMIITQNHNGTFDVQSEVGKYTKFIIRLPLG